LNASNLRILVAAGDQISLATTATTLESNGFSVLRANDSNAAVKCWQDHRPDVVLVDVLLPPHDGFDLCRHIRENSHMPIIMVATEALESEVVEGFTSGADDFVTRPFGLTQLAWRIRAVYGRYSTAERISPRPNQVKVGDLTLDPESHQIANRDRQAFLTPIEFRLFSALASNAGSIVSVAQLVDAAWSGRSNHPETVNSLKSHLARLRAKLRDLGGLPRDIDVVPGRGYILGRTSEPI
jgi:two-component system response regulator MtrA